jgi:predicted DNA-binding protein YlxM (UPF0122 family)
MTGSNLKVLPILNKDILYKLYVQEKKSLTEIAKIFNISAMTVLDRMKKFNIERRTKSEAAKGENNSFYGKHHTEEAREKMSEVKKGRHFSEEHKRKLSKARKGKKNPMYGKHRSEETKKKISEACKGEKNHNYGKHRSEEYKIKMREINKGENNPYWKGGITPENIKVRRSREMCLWRKAVLERDNFTCQACSKKGGKLHVHHINNFSDFPELRVAIDNGITLCKKCHKKFHHLYGVKNNTKEQLEDFRKIIRRSLCQQQLQLQK